MRFIMSKEYAWAVTYRDDREYLTWLTRQGQGVEIAEEEYTDRYSPHGEAKKRAYARAKAKAQ